MKRTTSKKLTIADLGEFGIIENIRNSVFEKVNRVAIGIGDDTAAVRAKSEMLTLATCDIQVEGRHFQFDKISAYQLGHRAAAINLSDIAAMGGLPTFALVSLVLPPELEVDWLEDLYRGLNNGLSAFDASIIGGNLTGGSSQIIVDMTLLGEVESDRIIRRTGLFSGDSILVTGHLGCSAAGRFALDAGLHSSSSDDVQRVIEAHQMPSPRVQEGRIISASRQATSMIDLSDGLAGDLRHICKESNAGARIFADRVPIDSATRQVAAALGQDPLSLALRGGEDYELAFTCPPTAVADMIKAVRDTTGTHVTEIGVITESRLELVHPDGYHEILQPGGWDHFQQGSPNV